MSTPQPLDGRVAIVTGASRGIGAATARALHRAGAAVVLAARDTEALTALAAEIDAAGGRALAVPTDVTDPTAVQHLVATTVDRFGRLDAAVNNAAGGGHPPTPLADVDITAFDSALAVNLRGVFLAMKYEIPAMLAGGGGAIVNMSSTAGLQAVGGLAGYVSSKFGLIGLTRTAALDYADAGIRVNALAPGPIHTEQLEAAGEQARQAAAQAMPMRRIGLPDEVAAAVVWLCSDESSFITGATLPIDGGKLAGAPPFRRPATAAQPRTNPTAT
ncbi:SDR family NAD(P)-dependent oxidoreductase [Embleya sp. NBC_00896]|uniref:SDR family NAD(P)-dependent oxidoreductase n=1 Tax=Embleya sp. NBC_00896 TaxID=2975961 RepID=UPI0038650AFD|nr:glucose 1-dehydrogenase [Embleya sp. NBC_00896]